MTEEERIAQVSEECEALNSIVGNLNEQDGYDCPLCKNKEMVYRVVKTGNVKNGVPEYIATQGWCICKPIRATLRRMNRSGLGDAIKEKTFSAFNAYDPWQKAFLEKAQNFVTDGGGVFFVGGQSGSGKTHICTAITGELIQRGKTAYYMKWEEEIVKLKANQMDDAKYQQQMNQLKTVDVLYIDDFFKPIEGAQKPTPADIRKCYELINYRYTSGSGVTIISSEHYIQEILDIDEATGGRLIEYAGEYMTNIKRDRSRNYRLRNLGMI